MNISKIKRDKYYNKLFEETNDFDSLVSSGYFEDNLDYINHNLNLLTTSIEKLSNFNCNKENIVLLTTGGFNPIHKGHINMMDLAKKEMLNRGYNVLGGYISPCHFNYYSKKNFKILNNSDRIQLIENELCKSDWLMIEPWESLYLKDTVNFTEVITRLEMYLNKFVNNKIKVIYVYGSDNINFSDCLSKTRDSICVSRCTEHINSDKCIVINNENNLKYLNSTSIRKENKIILNKKSNNFLIRTDDVELNNYSFYIKNLIKFFKNHLEEKSNIKIVSAVNQIKQSKLDLLGLKTISLDSCFIGNYNIEISRLFNVSSPQLNPISYVKRTGSLSIKEQLDKINPGNYTLVDDDSVSGTTINMIKNALNKNVNINNIYLMSNQNKLNYYDIVDSRDFLFNKLNSGLVVELNDSFIRVPYIYPFVCLNSRASIKYEDMAAFSIKVLEENINILDGYTVSDLIKDNQILFKYLGYNDYDKITNILNNIKTTLTIVDENLNL